uniref:polysaccharide pyruvyl transferase family protein n=1 Tax=uncultured Alteromonas sp. TaxID=179113 RepID=UPI0030D9B6F5
VFNHAKILALRESVSKKLLEEKFELPANYVEGADTAWLVRNNHVAIENTALNSFIKQRKTIAITLRELKPFDKRLGISQETYEAKYAELCNHLINNGYNVLACSTCTGIDGYQKDDRMVALRVQKNINQPENFKVVMDELNDVELGTLLSQCELTIGTRLHSAIISMNFGTPAFALNYEHKSEGIMNQLGLPDFGVPLGDLLNDELQQKVDNYLEDSVNYVEKVAVALKSEKERSKKMLQVAFSN